MAHLSGSRTIEIDAPLERCYEIVTDLAGTADWQKTTISVEVLESDPGGRWQRCRFVSDGKVRQLTSILKFTFHPPGEMRWEQEKGEMKWLRGAWKLEPLAPDRTQATFSLEADPGMVLGLLIRGPGVADRVKNHLTHDPTDGLKQAAEG